jgi:2-hydroxy-6-oxonona-2,4-dienedioate hydrolase
MNIEALTLDDNDPAVIAAHNAEQNLFKLYGLKATDHYIVLPGQNIKIRVSEFGSGKPLLVVPGNTGDVFPLASLLAEIKDRRIIALNRPGGGLSEGIDHSTVNIRPFAVQTIITVIDYFNLDTVDILAHSMGAHWSFWTAMDKPDRVSSLTLLGNPGNVMKGKPPLLLRLMLKWPFNKLFIKVIQGSADKKKLTMLKAMGSTQQTVDNLPKELEEAYFYFRRLPHYIISFISLMKNGAPNIDASQLSLVKQPAQLILGDHDTFASVAVGQSIAGAMPNCQLHVIKNAGHLPWLESPAECGELVNDFLSRN